MSSDFAVVGKVIMNKGRLTILVPSRGVRQGSCYLFDSNDVETQTHQTVRNVLSWSVVEKVTKYSFNGISDFGEKVK
jgi:hypothetical protein